MTFYNIIFGLLFIGAFREVIFALAQGPDWPLFCLTATLSVLVFSDTIYTSVVIEDRVIATFLIQQAGLKRAEAQSGAVTLIQRFGSAANLNIHLHCLLMV